MTTAPARFRTLHESGTFVMPNPFDVGSAALLEHLGFDALATTSAGFAATLGRLDMTVTRDELVDHVGALTAATRLPLNVDAERCFADDPDGIVETVELLAAAGAAGISIEDWNPATGRIDDLDESRRRVSAATGAARQSGLVVTARCENHLHDVADLDDTIARLTAYVEDGADVVYAPGLTNPAHIERVVAIGAPVNVLLMPTGPTVADLAGLGVRRVSVGSTLANIAYGAMVDAAHQLREHGMFAPTSPILPTGVRDQAFGTT